jgi:hypothetical protein
MFSLGDWIHPLELESLLWSIMRILILKFSFPT